MTKVISLLKKHILIVLFILIIPSFISLVRPGFFPMQDDLQAFRIQQMDKCFQNLQLPCRWVPDAGYQYGYPQFIFYPPSVYYVGEAFHLFGFQFIDAVKILFVLGFISSAFGMYLLLKSFLAKWPALVGAILYTYVPYRAVEVYVRGAMSEFWALSVFPLVFWSAYQLIEKKQKKYFVYFALSIGSMFLTHSLMSLIFAPVIAVWIISWIVLEKRWSSLIKVILSGLLGVGLAAFFVFPVLVEKPFVHSESLLGGYFDYRQHFVNLDQLFVSNYFGYGSSELGDIDDLALTTGPIHAAATFLAVILGLATFRKNKKLSILSFILASTSLLVLFMIHQKSSFIWSLLPILAWLQFPWRFLAVSIFLLSIMSALLVYFARSTKFYYPLGVLLIGAVLFLHAANFVPQKWLDITDQDKFSGVSWQKQLTISIFDYLPIYAKLPPTSAAPAVPEVLDGKAQFSNYQKGSDFQYGQVKVEKDATIRIPMYDYPGMQVKVNGQVVSHIHTDCRGEEFCLGLITIQLSPGDYKIETHLTKTPVRLVGDTVSLLSFLVIVWLAFQKYVKKSK